MIIENRLIRLLYYYFMPMEKLMKYVEEMQKEWINICRPQSQEYYLVDMMLVSKYYWLIKRLVENDKIDKKKIDTRLVRNVESHYDEEWYWVENSYEDYSDTDTLLMLLSISDKPIEDLISYLK
jgi:hypothetical protein